MRRQQSKTRQRERARGVTCSLVHVQGICEDVLCELRVIVVVVTFTSNFVFCIGCCCSCALVDLLDVGTIFVAIFVVREIYSLQMSK